MLELPKFLRTLLLVIVIVGALNWGLVHFLRFNLVGTLTSLTGQYKPVVESVVYGVVAGSAAVLLVDKQTFQV
jgi:uncharacterized membrane protein YuzA (DUF378 family)